jgi:hypothetical protein
MAQPQNGFVAANHNDAFQRLPSHAFVSGNLSQKVGSSSTVLLSGPSVCGQCWDDNDTTYDSFASLPNLAEHAALLLLHRSSLVRQTNCVSSPIILQKSNRFRLSPISNKRLSSRALRTSTYLRKISLLKATP